MAMSSFLHPSLGFLILALVLPFLRGAFWKWLLILPPLAAIWSVFSMEQGVHAILPYLGQELVLGRVDPVSLIFAQVFAFMSLIGMVYAMHVTDKGQHIAASLYVAGGFGCVFSGDYLTLFLFWELMSLGSVFLIFLNRTRESTLAGFRYFLYHTIGGLFLLGGLLLRYKATGSLAFTQIIPDNTAYYDWLILFGFCVNAAVVPLHAWLPDAYPRGTVTGSVFMCAFTTKTAVYVLMRGFTGWEILAVAGVIMAVYGALYATMENDGRRILSYHIVSQVGFMVAGIGVGTAMTINGAAAHAYAHIIYKGLLFMSVGAVLYSAGTARLDRLGGLVGHLPWVMILYMIAALSISGMPLFNGFVTKTMTIAGVAEAHHTWLAMGLEIASVGTFLSVGLKLPYFIFWGKKPASAVPADSLKPIPANMYVAMGFAALICVAQGLYPDMLYRYLPYQLATPYVPWTLWHVLQALMLLGGAGLAVYLCIASGILGRHSGQNLDFDYFYRLIGRGVLALICKPIGWIDTIWNNVYQSVGLKALMGFALGSSAVDKTCVDGALDGSAYAVRGIGRIGAKLQDGVLQDYVALTTVFAILIFGLVWYFG